MLQQPAGQLDPRAAPDPMGLPSQGPDHPGAIGDDHAGVLDGLPQGGIRPGRHRHLGIQRDDLTAAGVMERHGIAEHIVAYIHRDAQHTGTDR